MRDTRAKDSLKGLYRFGNTCAAKGHDISGGSVTKCEAVILGRIAACFCHPGRGNALLGILPKVRSIGRQPLMCC